MPYVCEIAKNDGAPLVDYGDHENQYFQVFEHERYPGVKALYLYRMTHASLLPGWVTPALLLKFLTDLLLNLLSISLWESTHFSPKCYVRKQDQTAVNFSVHVGQSWVLFETCRGWTR